MQHSCRIQRRPCQQRSELEAVVGIFAGTRPSWRALAVELPSISLYSSCARSSIGSRRDRTPSTTCPGARRYLAERGVANATPAVLVEWPYYGFRIFALTAALCVAEARTRAELKHIINNGGLVVPALSLGFGGHGREFDESLYVKFQY